MTLCQLLAPFTPFISEEIYKNLTGNESVHLSDWPKTAKLTAGDQQLIADMKLVRKIVELGLSKRKEAGMKVRQPLRCAHVTGPHQSLSGDLQKLISDELNVKSLNWEKGQDLSVSLDLNLDAGLIAEGNLRELIRQVQEARKAAGARLDQHIILKAPYPDDPDLQSRLKNQTLARQLIADDFVSVELL